MGLLTATYGLRFARPLWLLGGLLVVPVVWLALRSLGQLGRARRWSAVVLRALVVAVLAVALARPMATQSQKDLSLIVVFDRSGSVPEPLRRRALEYLARAVRDKPPGDRLAVVDVAETAMITRLPSSATEVPLRNVHLVGSESALAEGVQLGMAIAPPTTGTRVLLISDGNETRGDLAEVARVAAANKIPIDVLPLRYHHRREVVFKRLVAPPAARSGQTIPLRFVLSSTSPEEVSGRLTLSLNGRPVDLDPAGPGLAMPVLLKPGTNVRTISLPLPERGVLRFECTFKADDPRQDQLERNNRVSAVTCVAGPGHVLVVGRLQDAEHLLGVLRAAGLDVRHCPPGSFPDSLAGLLATDAVVLVNTEQADFTYRQQEMLVRYVRRLGGGLVMVGGPRSFGAGGWIGSPLASVLPVDPDPPQKKQMPRGALVLIMHACEMPRGNFWGKRVAIAAVNALSRYDLLGVLDYGWGAGGAHWVFPTRADLPGRPGRLAAVGDKKAPVARIRAMQMGDMPDFHVPMQAAYDALMKAKAGQKHIIIISDGDPAPPQVQLIKKMRKAGITCSTVLVCPHSGLPKANFFAIARATGGRCYDVKDPTILPQIFVKEAQVVRRVLIVEETFAPRLVNPLSELVRGFKPGEFPKLDGYVLTGPKGGLTQLVLTTPDGDPLLASAQMGLGRTAAFTSGAGSLWASRWVGKWGGYGRFWEQLVRWAGRPSQAADCQVYADLRGRDVTVTVDAVDAAGQFVQFAQLAGVVITPEMRTRQLVLQQVGPGRYRAAFKAGAPGSYLVSLHYRKAGRDGGTGMVNTVVTVPFAPEYRDLRDNLALLARVAAATGGRVLSGGDDRTDLFDRSGVQFPYTAVPLSRYFLIAWVVLFLLDVAVRRVVVDFRALARRAAGWVRSLRPRRASAEGTVEQLRARTRAVREQMTPGPAEPLASRR
ncbi:MAG: hypothetical protein B1H04_02440, partial [Planctomycetales bacterium 4484_123]